MRGEGDGSTRRPGKLAVQIFRPTIPMRPTPRCSTVRMSTPRKNLETSMEETGNFGAFAMRSSGQEGRQHRESDELALYPLPSGPKTDVENTAKHAGGQYQRAGRIYKLLCSRRKRLMLEARRMAAGRPERTPGCSKRHHK